MEPTLATRTSLQNSSQKMHVLFVGSDPYNQPYDFLEEIDFNKATITGAVQKISGKEATCDAVVVDATVDSANVKILRKVTAEKNLPLILYTSYFDQRMKDRALRMKADDYVTGSMRYSFGSRIKLVKQLRKFKIQWLRQENEFHVKKNKIQQFLEQRLPDILISFVALILFSPSLLIVAIVQEIESMEEHVFSDSRNKRLINRAVNWYQFTVLILFSPVFAIIKLPVRIFRSGEGFFKENENQGDRFYKVLQRKVLDRLLHLLNVLKGNTSLFKDNHFQEHSNQFDQLEFPS